MSDTEVDVSTNSMRLVAHVFARRKTESGAEQWLMSFADEASESASPSAVWADASHCRGRESVEDFLSVCRSFYVFGEFIMRQTMNERRFLRCSYTLVSLSCHAEKLDDLVEKMFPVKKGDKA